MYFVAYETSSNTENFYLTMRCLWIMFLTAVCFLFLLKLKWSKNKNIYDVDPTSSNAMNAFVGSKESERIPSSGKHCSLQAFVKHMVGHAGLREETQK